MFIVSVEFEKKESTRVGVILRERDEDFCDIQVNKEKFRLRIEYQTQRLCFETNKIQDFVCVERTPWINPRKIQSFDSFDLQSENENFVVKVNPKSSFFLCRISRIIDPCL